MSSSVLRERVSCETQSDMLETRVLGQPVIVRNILSWLPMRTLNTVARVNKLWANVVEQEKRGRRGIAWSYHLCESKNNLDKLLHEIEEFVKNLYFEPMFALVFCATSLFEKTIAHTRNCWDWSSKCPSRSPKLEKIQVTTFLQRQMPSNCTFTTVASNGIIGTSSDSKITAEMEGGEKGRKKKCLSFVVFSKFAGDAEIIPIYYDQLGASKLAACWNSMSNMTRVQRIPEDKNIKSVLLLCADSFYSQEFGFAIYKMSKCPMVAGGFVDDVTCPPWWDENRDLPFMCCVAFCGTELKVASVVLREDVNTPEGAEKIIKKLKSYNIPEQNSVGFMFACVGRGENHYGEENVESSIFRKCFPNTPLLGFFGNGEVGFEYPHKKPEDLEDCGTHDRNGLANHRFVQTQSSYLAAHPPKMYHAYTTIMCIASFPL